MGMVKVHKVVSALPSPLEADAIYAVRTGSGFDLHVADVTGSVAHALNRAPTLLASPIKRIVATGWDGYGGGVGYGGGSFNADRFTICPRIAPPGAVINTMTVFMQAAAPAGTEIGFVLYDANADGLPGALRYWSGYTAIGGLAAGQAVTHAAPAPIVLPENRLFYAGVRPKGATLTLRSVLNVQMPTMGIDASGSTVVGLWRLQADTVPPPDPWPQTTNYTNISVQYPETSSSAAARIIFA